ncbi:MAG: hypothetical protein U0325_28175 [Polyangiales bacterium]
MSPAPPFAPAPPPDAFGPPPGSFGARWAPPSGPTLDLRPEGGGGFAATYVALGCYLATLAGAATMAVITLAGRGDRETTAVVAGLLLVGGVLGYLGAVMTWIYQSWRYLPAPYRRTASGREVTPSWAVVGFFVPFYNLYWIFAQSHGYCEALDSAVVQSGRRGRSPKALATAASVVQLVPYLNHLVGPILWLALMVQTDRLKARLAAPREG